MRNIAGDVSLFGRLRSRKIFASMLSIFDLASMYFLFLKRFYPTFCVFAKVNLCLFEMSNFSSQEVFFAKTEKKNLANGTFLGSKVKTR